MERLIKYNRLSDQCRTLGFVVTSHNARVYRLIEPPPYWSFYLSSATKDKQSSRANNNSNNSNTLSKF